MCDQESISFNAFIQNPIPDPAPQDTKDVTSTPPNIVP